MGFRVFIYAITFNFNETLKNESKRGNKMTLLKQIEQAVGEKKTTKIINLINSLFWEADRMSEAGNETLNQLADMLETEADL